MKDERGRDGIEQLRIVDAEDHRPARGARAQILAAASEQRHDVVGADLVGHEIGDRRQGNRGRAARGLDPVDERAVTFGRGLRLAGQARLANARLRRRRRPRGMPALARAAAIASSSRSRPTSGQSPTSAGMAVRSRGIPETNSTLRPSPAGGARARDQGSDGGSDDHARPLRNLAGHPRYRHAVWTGRSRSSSSRSATSTARSRSIATRSASTSTTTPRNEHMHVVQLTPRGIRLLDRHRRPARADARWRPARCGRCSCASPMPPPPAPSSSSRGVECSELTVVRRSGRQHVLRVRRPGRQHLGRAGAQGARREAADPGRGSRTVRRVTPRSAAPAG